MVALIGSVLSPKENVAANKAMASRIKNKSDFLFINSRILKDSCLLSAVQIVYFESNETIFIQINCIALHNICQVN